MNAYRKRPSTIGTAELLFRLRGGATARRSCEEVVVRDFKVAEGLQRAKEAPSPHVHIPSTVLDPMMDAVDKRRLATS